MADPARTRTNKCAKKTAIDNTTETLTEAEVPAPLPPDVPPWPEPTDRDDSFLMVLLRAMSAWVT